MKRNLLLLIIKKKVFCKTYFSVPFYFIKTLTIFTSKKSILIQLFQNSLLLYLAIMLPTPYLKDWLHNLQGLGQNNNLEIFVQKHEK